MSDPSKLPPGYSSGGKKVPAAKPSTAYGPAASQPTPSPIPMPAAKAKPPVVAGPATQMDSVPMLGPGQVSAPGPAFPPPGTGGTGNPSTAVPPIPRRNNKNLGLILGLVVTIPVCMIVACGIGGYFLLAKAKKSVTTAVNKAQKQNAQAKIDPRDPFAALNDPDVQKKMEEGFKEAFGKLDEELKKQQAAESGMPKRGKTRPGSKSNSNGPPPGFPNINSNPPPNFPRPGEPDQKDDFPTNLKRLQAGNDDEKRRAAEWFSRAPLETDKQEEVSKALNNMHTDALRKHALGALKVWGTKENVPIIAKIMQQEAFVKIDCMDLLEKFKDERAIEPLISTLNEAFREGERAEEILGDWWPQAEQPLVKHLHDKEGRIRERTYRILELRKTDQALLITQTLEDIKSSNRDVRKSAVDWLAKLEVKPDLQPQVAAAAQSLLTDSNGDIRRQALEMFGKYAQKEQADDLVKLLEEKDRDKWLAGLTGLIRLGDVRAAEPIGRRKELRGDAFRLFRETGAPAQDIVAKTLTHIEVKDWGAGKDLCEILGEIGTSKSVGFLQQVKKKAVLSKTPFVPEAADKAVEDIRRRNAG